MATLTVNNAGGTLDYYRILGVAHSADYREIDASYWHLVRGAAGAQMAELNEAYETLGNDERRRAFDARWAETAPPAGEGRAQPVNASLEPEPAPQLLDRAEADLDDEEPNPEAPSAPPVPKTSQLRPQPRTQQDDPADAGLAGRLDWPPV